MFPADQRSDRDGFLHRPVCGSPAPSTSSLDWRNACRWRAQARGDARRPPANARDRNDRSATQPHKHVRKLLQARGTRRKSRSVLGLREEVVVCQEESIDGTVKHDNLDLLVSLERRDGSR
jgi:hypothetical protein